MANSNGGATGIGGSPISAWPWPVARALAWAILAVLVMQLAGCAAFAPPRPYTTETEALAERGEPTRRWSNEDGTTTLEYATQPNGWSCLMVEVDAGGVVLRQWDALAPENLARVERGMDKEQVSRLLGTHRSEQRFRNSGEEVWDWNVRNDGPGIATLFNVHFIDDKVVRTSQTHVYPRDGVLFGGWAGYYGYPWGWGMGWGYPRPFYRHPFAHPWYW
ncbi:hypothetical protein [Thauera sp.]|uniref:hypothetical protein n=1 Tax=Thauera sp. TaxID=1905334 RepID=UPI00258A31EC|nr:hypothetical protein [Thauera sp.]